MVSVRHLQTSRNEGGIHLLPGIHLLERQEEETVYHERAGAAPPRGAWSSDVIVFNIQDSL